MRASRTKRNAHHCCRFFDLKVVVEDQLKRLALAARQTSERLLKDRLHLPTIGRLIRMLDSRRTEAAFGGLDHDRASQEVSSTLIRGGLANHCKQPGLERRISVEARLALEHFHIDVMKHVFSFSRIAATTAHRPAEAGRMMLLELC